MIDRLLIKIKKENETKLLTQLKLEYCFPFKYIN